jgi:uncharacterized protein (TIGR02284 family)
MAERTERWTLNHLIQTCRDGERGFRYAANHAASPDVKALFLEIATQRQQFVEALLPHAHRLGGEAEADGSVVGALHRGWMTVRDTLAPHDDGAIIREAERGERAALTAYEEALKSLLPPESRDLIESQRAHIQHTYRRLNSLLTGDPVGN